MVHAIINSYLNFIDGSNVVMNSRILTSKLYQMNLKIQI